MQNKDNNQSCKLNSGSCELRPKASSDCPKPQISITALHHTYQGGYTKAKDFATNSSPYPAMPNKASLQVSLKFYKGDLFLVRKLFQPVELLLEALKEFLSEVENSKRNHNGKFETCGVFENDCKCNQAGYAIICAFNQFLSSIKRLHQARNVSVIVYCLN